MWYRGVVLEVGDSGYSSDCTERIDLSDGLERVRLSARVFFVVPKEYLPRITVLFRKMRQTQVT